MTPEQRFLRALRDAADAYEEIVAGKRRKPRHRGPVRADGPEPTPAIRAQALAHLGRAGVVRVK